MMMFMTQTKKYSDPIPIRFKAEFLTRLDVAMVQAREHLPYSAEFRSKQSFLRLCALTGLEVIEAELAEELSGQADLFRE